MLRLTTWNVNGLFRKSPNLSKLEDNSFLGSVVGYDIIGLIETHAGPDDSICLENYTIYQVNRPKSNKAYKFSGGLAALIKNDITKGVTIVNSGLFAIWLKLDHDLFGFSRDVYVCITYLPPDNSTYSKRLEINCVDILEKDIQNFTPLGEIILLGDINARTACNADYLLNDTDKFIPDPIPYIMDDDLPIRSNQDTITNERGLHILDVCISSGLRILNGRKPGDTLGYFTCHKYNGSSTIDYGIVSEMLFKDVVYFHVHSGMSDLSDHCQISLSIQNCNFQRNSSYTIALSPSPLGYIYGKNLVN